MTRWCAIHPPRSPEPTRPARAPPILRPTPPLVGDRTNGFHSDQIGSLGTLVTSGCTWYHRPHPQPTGHPLQPRETSKTSTGHAVQSSNRIRSKSPTLEAAMLLQNARTSCRRTTPRRRCRHRRLARTVQAEFRPALRPPGSLGRPQRLPREHPTLSRALADRTSIIPASLATPCLMLCGR